MANKEFFDWYCSRPIQWGIHEHYSQLEMIVMPKGSTVFRNPESEEAFDPDTCQIKLVLDVNAVSSDETKGTDS